MIFSGRSYAIIVNMVSLKLKLASLEFALDCLPMYSNHIDFPSSRIFTGFENANDPCCGGYFPPFVCFKGSNASTTSVLCDDRSKYVFWDAYHPTEAANIIISKMLLDGDESVSFPINVHELYNKN